MKNIMELDHRGETEVQDTRQSLPKDLQEAKHLEVSAIPLQYQNHRLPGALVVEHPVA